MSILDYRGNQKVKTGIAQLLFVCNLKKKIKIEGDIIITS